MKDNERTQLSYVAQALVRARPEEWTGILDVAELPAETGERSESFVAAVKELRRATSEHQTIGPLVKALVSSSDGTAQSVGRVLEWSMKGTDSESARSR